MGMTITIEDSVNRIKADMNCRDCEGGWWDEHHSVCRFCDYNKIVKEISIKEAETVAIDTMRKYQKIQAIVKSWNDMNSFDSMVNISEVVENGNVD